MKRVLLIALSLLFVTCKNKPQNETGSTGNSKPAGHSQSTLNKGMAEKKLKQLVAGNWVKSNYIKAIIETKSPFKAHSMLAGVASMYIDAKNAGNFVKVGFNSENIYSGGSFKLLFKPGKKPNSMKITHLTYSLIPQHFSFELAYNIKGPDTTLILYQYNKKGALNDSTVYSKINIANNNSTVDAADGITNVVNQKLIIGDYNLTDASGRRDLIKLSKDGAANGFLSARHYYVVTTFLSGTVEGDLDMIIFDMGSKVEQRYAFAFDVDTLKLYDIKIIEGVYKESMGDLLYKLVKQNK